MMGGGHRHAADHQHLHVPRDTPVHRLAPEAKLVGLVVFVTVVAVTPRQLVAVFALDAVVLAGVVIIARLPIRVVAARLLVITPFVAFAVLVPFVAGGDQVEVLGTSLSVDGLWATWNIVTKATLGATASIVLSATTPIPELLRGLSRLRVPSALVGIVAFMFRYLDLLVDQLQRMRNAMVARCHDPRWLWQIRPIASSAGALFVRSYERGERVHHAMLARGFMGTMPDLHAHHSHRRDWIVAAVPGVVAVTALATALVIR